MPMPDQPDLHSLSLSQIAQLAADAKLPPVDKWNPEHCGHSGMRIARDGTWYHEGAPIGRETMVRLFSTILRREPEGGYVLVTPVEKLDIDVEDAPFQAVEMKAEGEGRDARLAFRLNTGDLVTAGPDHPLRFAADADSEGVRPYLLVRRGLEALVARSVYYELADRVIAGGGAPGVWSDGAFFPLPDRA
jgi:hypothetical protein